MVRQHYQPQPRHRGIGRALRGIASAVVLVGTTVGLPWMFLSLAGSPIPDRLPGWDEIVAALSRRDDGTLFLGFITYFAWVMWLIWIGLLAYEAAAQLRGRSAPQIPGLGGPQQLAAVLIGSLGATLIGTSVSMSRASALPAQPPNLTVSTAPPHATHASADSAADELPATQKVAPARLAGARERPVYKPARAASPSRQRQTVRFAFDSAGLSAEARAALDQAAEDIRRHADPARPITVVGHTDSLGPAAYNQRLSLSRAQAVREALGHLAGHGFHFQVSGRGESDPIARETRPNGSDDPAGRARNRRVEITYTLRQTTRPTPAPPSSPRPSTSPPAPPHTPQSSSPPTTPQPSTSSPGSGAGAPTAPSTTPPATPPASPSPPDRHQHSPTAVRLPTGALVGLGLASAVSVAVAATRLHRRRRRRPDPDRLTVAEPEPASPPSVQTLRKAHLDSYTAEDKPVPSDTQLVEDDVTTEAPTHLTVGVRDQAHVRVPVAGLNVGLIGPGARDAARAMATELLASSRRSCVELVIPEHTATTVFDLTIDDLAQLAGLVPGLILTPDLDGALRHLETEILHRSRMMADHEAADVAALRTADPAEPLPTIVLITELGESERFTATLEATLHLAERHGIGGLLLGPWPAGTTFRIDTDGQVIAADGPDASTWADAQLFHLNTAEATDLLQVIRTARGADEPSPTEPTTEPPVPPHDDDHPTPAPAALQPPPLDEEEEQGRPVRIRVLGPVGVETTNGPVSTGLRRISRDFLAFLALHPDGVTREEGVDALWPDRDLDSGSTMFHTAVNSIRQALRKATGLREPMFVTYIDGRYRLDDHLFDVDLWHFLRALDEASRADNDTDRGPALRRLADLYAGELAEDLTYEWAERERERIRRTATDALVRLARILQSDQPDDALAVLEQAFDHDPVSEPLAGDLMRLQAQLGHFDAVRRTHRLLRYRLDDLDLDPSEETERLVAELLSQRKQQIRRRRL